jgi:L-aminopeptidase/D-esterase-like protein
MVSASSALKKASRQKVAIGFVGSNNGLKSSEVKVGIGSVDRLSHSAALTTRA